ncbi:sulfite exporter TauE/SafE family protein [Chitinophaga sp. Cy-1792]|uniref:sulfite exporter TauE/SafE family protein n=1 Tax=Chitinophaga sp. Cy-1792 TaxID=2608339 RepID=UPI001422E554|nr:sulfite exporter TauE/SafE family protein [Chitinophaga sp. Cy-1792]NIG54595.1 sulfite exporter TauE/SafE family protein [Chitinophaga sp. Cy-1792]
MEKVASPAVTAAIEPTPAKVSPASPRKNRLLWWAAAVILVLVILATAWWHTPAFRAYAEEIPSTFYYFLIAGFIFAMIDGAIGMSYGITSTTFSLSMGIPPASASTAVHISEILSNGIAGWMHFKMGNINKKLFKLLIIPGITGAVIGAYLLSSLEHYSTYTKPVVSLYTLILGSIILKRAIQARRAKVQQGKKIKKIGILGFFGGFIDAIGGGGWGSIVLSSLIAGGRHPRFSLGTVKLCRFFIAMLSSLTFVTVLSHVHWDAVSGLVIGSALASPIAAKVSNRISAKTIMIAVAVIVILASLKSIYGFTVKIL